jgi:hypothetical protein
MHSLRQADEVDSPIVHLLDGNEKDCIRSTQRVANARVLV